jgi:hypothetical protein
MELVARRLVVKTTLKFKTETLAPTLRRSASHPVGSRFEIIRRLDIGCAKGV